MNLLKTCFGLFGFALTAAIFACSTTSEDPTASSEAESADTTQCKTELVCTWKQIKGEGGYNIYVKECHAACVRFIMDNPTDTVGACVCQPGGKDGIEGHTVNWYIKDPSSKTPSYCIVEPQNGQACCWPVTVTKEGQIPQPPPTDSGDGQTCLKQLCGTQYGAGTSVCNKVGEGLPKVPSATDCKVANTGKSQDVCNKCCDDRAGYWDAVWINDLKTQIAAEADPAKKKALQDELDKRIKDREDFRTACKNSCKLTPAPVEEDASVAEKMPTLPME